MVGGVDPDDADGVAELVLVERRDHVGPGSLLDPRRDRVLEVEEELVGAEGGVLTGLPEHLLELPGTATHERRSLIVKRYLHAWLEGRRLLSGRRESPPQFGCVILPEGKHAPTPRFVGQRSWHHRGRWR